MFCSQHGEDRALFTTPPPVFLRWAKSIVRPVTAITVAPKKSMRNTFSGNSNNKKTAGNSVTRQGPDAPYHVHRPCTSTLYHMYACTINHLINVDTSSEALPRVCEKQSSARANHFPEFRQSSVLRPSKKEAQSRLMGSTYSSCASQPASQSHSSDHLSSVCVCQRYSLHSCSSLLRTTRQNHPRAQYSDQRPGRSGLSLSSPSGTSFAK